MIDLRAGRIGHFVRVLTLVVTGLTLGDLSSSQAQGPLRRLGDRIRARVDTLVQPPPAPPTAAPQAAPGLRPVAPYSTPNSQDKPLAQPTVPSREPTLARQPAPSGSESSGAPSIGIEVDEFNSGFRGVRVVSFRSNSQANAAGLRIGDVIVGVEGRTTATIAEVAQSLSSLNAGESVQLRIVRSESLSDANVARGQRQIPTQFLDVPLVDRLQPANQIAARREFESNQQANYDQQAQDQQTSDATLGVVVRNAPGRQGAVVESVLPRSPGEVARMRAGDRIVSINGRTVRSTESVSQVLNSSEPGEQLRVQWVRDDTLREANVILAGKDGISPNALANRSPSDSSQSDGASEPATGSLLNGIGSTFGNWFGNSTNASAKQQTAESPQQSASPMPADELPSNEPGRSNALSDISGPSILMGIGEASAEPRGIGSEELPMPKAIRDPLEFGDEELVQPATFGESTIDNGTSVLPIPASVNASRKPAITPLDGKTDPPSLDEVTPPLKQPAGSTSKEDQTILLLRSEIERLRSRIQQLEK